VQQISQRGMSERFDESAKKALLLSRKIASRDGAAVVEPHHLLLALQVVIPEVFGCLSELARDSPIEEPTTQYQDVIFSHASKRSLACAAGECERLNQRLISPTHILTGLHREQHGDVASEPW
jgi:hypothetical protein